MNNQRRKDIQEIIQKMSTLSDMVEEIKEAVEAARDEEQEYLDNMPESLQVSDRGIAAEEAIDSLGEAWDVLDEFDTDTLTSNLEDAAS